MLAATTRPSTAEAEEEDPGGRTKRPKELTNTAATVKTAETCGTHNVVYIIPKLNPGHVYAQLKRFLSCCSLSHGTSLAKQGHSRKLQS